jgi:hypothetical protein
MKNKRIGIITLKNITLIIITNFIIGLNLFSAEKSHSDFIFFPKETREYENTFYVGLNMSIIPKMITEEEIRQIPCMEANYRLGLPFRTSLLAKISANYFTNQISLGLLHSLSISNLSLGIGDYHSFWFGYSKLDGFDNYAEGWLNTPFFIIGYDFEDVKLSLKNEINFVTSETFSAGNIQVGSKKNFVSGVAFTLSLEQPLWKDNIVLLSTKINYNKSNNKYWPAFFTTKNWFFFPEFSFGLIW